MKRHLLRDFKLRRCRRHLAVGPEDPPLSLVVTKRHHSLPVARQLGHKAGGQHLLLPEALLHSPPPLGPLPLIPAAKIQVVGPLEARLEAVDAGADDTLLFQSSTCLFWPWAKVHVPAVFL